MWQWVRSLPHLLTPLESEDAKNLRHIGFSDTVASLAQIEIEPSSKWQWKVGRAFTHKHEEGRKYMSMLLSSPCSDLLAVLYCFPSKLHRLGARQRSAWEVSEVDVWQFPHPHLVFFLNRKTPAGGPTTFAGFFLLIAG